jgi:succinate dehydrogenase hydrophobic anchor subunit
VTAVRSDPPSTARGQTVTWWVTSFTGVGLLVLLTVHMVAHHFVVESTGGLRTYEQVLDYIANPLILTVEIAFLVLVTVHAMLGLRSVLFDLATGERARTRISRGLVALGVLTVAYGILLVGILAARA